MSTNHTILWQLWIDGQIYTCKSMAEQPSFAAPQKPVSKAFRGIYFRGERSRLICSVIESYTNRIIWSFRLTLSQSEWLYNVICVPDRVSILCLITFLTLIILTRLLWWELQLWHFQIRELFSVACWETKLKGCFLWYQLPWLNRRERFIIRCYLSLAMN